MSDGETLIDGETAAALEGQHGPVCAVQSMGRVFGFKRADKAIARRFRSGTKRGDEESDVRLLQDCVVYCSDGDSLQMLNQHLDEYVFADTGLASAVVRFSGFDPKALQSSGNG